MKSRKPLQIGTLAPVWLLRKVISCKTAVALASRSLDGALPISERFQLRMHLLVCTMCVRYLSQIRMIRDGLLEMGTISESKNLPGELSNEVRERIKKSLR